MTAMGYQSFATPATEELKIGINLRRQTLIEDCNNIKQIAGVTEVIEELGRGTFHRMYRCSWQKQLVAVKISTGEQLIPGKHTEATFTKRLQHPHLVKVLAAFSGSPAVVVTEWCAMSMDHFLHRRISLPPLVLIQFCFELASALAYLHAEGLCHRGIASVSCFVNGKITCASSLSCKLGGLSHTTHVSTQTSGIKNDLVEKVRYSAPEVSSEDEVYQTPADVFSLAVLMHELLSGEEPYAGMEFVAIVLRIADGQHPDEKLLDNHPATAEIGHWLVKCWAADAGKRPSAKALESQLRQILAEGENSDMPCSMPRHTTYGNEGEISDTPRSMPRQSTTCSWP